MNSKLVIVGAFHEVIELAESCRHEIVGLIDHQETTSRYSYPYLGSDENATPHLHQFADAEFILAPDSPSVRRRLHDHYSRIGCRFGRLVSSESKVSVTATLERGVVMQTGTYVSCSSVIGCQVKLNVAANVMHDSVIGDFTTIAPGAVVLGRVRIGVACYVGANSTILPGLSIGDHSIVGAGAVVTKDVPEYVIVAGNPARILRQINKNRI